MRSYYIHGADLSLLAFLAAHAPPVHGRPFLLQLPSVCVKLGFNP